MKLNIITSVYRIHNLPILKSNIEKEVTPYFDVSWYCMYDAYRDQEIVEQLSVSGMRIISMKKAGYKNGSGKQINIVLDLIESGWIYVLDDDNLLYENFGSRMSNLIKENPDHLGFIFNQKISSNTEHLALPENIKPCRIDMAQFILNKTLIGNNKLIEEEPTADGLFIEKIYNENPAKIKLVNEYLCYYNKLNPDHSK